MTSYTHGNIGMTYCYGYSTLCVQEPHWSGFPPFAITHFNTTVLTYDRFWRFRMRPHGWRVSFIPSPATAQITLSPVKICILLMETDCFHTLWYDTLPQSLKKFYVSKKCLYFNKTSFHDFVPFEVISHFYHRYFVSSWNPTLTTDSNVPFKNRKWDAAVNATHLLIRLSIKSHFFAILNLCFVKVDTVQRSVSIQYNAFSAIAALINHLEWEEIVKFKTITADKILYLFSLTIMTDKLNSTFCIVRVQFHCLLKSNYIHLVYNTIQNTD